jgi:hypothetical protein
MTAGSRTLAVLALAAWVACSGGGGGGSVVVDPTAVSLGAINVIGSAGVAGTLWDTDNSEVLFDGTPGVPADLALGMVAAIQGTPGSEPDTGTAQFIEVDDLLEGPLDVVVDMGANRKELEMVGQTVIALREGTYFGGDMGFDFDTLAPDDLLEVWGYLDGTGVVHATRIEKDGVYGGGIPTVAVKGDLSNLNVAGPGGSFEVGGLTVLYDDADLVGVPGGEAGLAGNPYVGVLGAYDALQGEITATEVSIEGPFTSTVSNVGIEGIVSDFTSLSSPFKVGFQPVQALPFVQQEPPDLSTFLTNGMLILAEGSMANSLLTADTLRFREAELRIAAQLASDDDVDAVAGTIELLGIPIDVDAVTRLVDARSGVDPLTLAHLIAGDYLDVRGIDLGGTVLATSLVRDFVGDVKLRGEVEASNGPPMPNDFTILGVLVPTNGSTLFSGFPSVANQADYYSYLFSNPGSFVEATDLQGDGSEANIDVANEVELADDL